MCDCDTHDLLFGEVTEKGKWKSEVLFIIHFSNKEKSKKSVHLSVGHSVGVFQCQLRDANLPHPRGPECD